MRNLYCLLLFLCLLLGACKPQAVQESSAVLSPLEPCVAGSGTVNAECGVLTVPEDRAHPNGRKLELKVVVVRAQESGGEPDPLFYLTGGPGVPATSDNVVLSVKSIFREINARRDVVFLDQRGTNDKHRLTCDPIPFAITEETPQQQVDDWMQDCLSDLDGDPRFYTTAAFIRDLDDARAALGYDKINLYGISYGVAAEQVYMRTFPERVRAVVMDHGTALDLPFRYVLPRASQAAMDQIFTYCELDEQCSAAYPNIRADWKKVIDRLTQGPVTTSFVPPGTDEPATVTLESIVEGAHDLMYQSGKYSMLPFLTHILASNEDWTSIVKTLVTQNTTPSSDNRLLLMHHVIFCFDPAWGTDPDQAARYSPGSYYTDLEKSYLVAQQKICAALPEPDPSLIYGPGKPVPLSALILNSLIDPQNPPSNMDLALNEFTESRLVVETTEGHDTSGSGCRWNIITQYLEDGSADKLDTACLQEKRPSFIVGSQ